MFSQTFIIDSRHFGEAGKLAGMNELVAANRKGFYMGAKLKSDMDEVVGAAIWDAKLEPMNKPVDIHIYWVEPNMRRDHDNVAAGKKFILDALVRCGVLPNDKPANVVDFVDEFAVSKQNPRIEVTLIERSSRANR